MGSNALGAGEITVNDGGQLFIFGGGSYAKTVHITGLGWRESSAGGNAYGALRLDSGVTWSGLVDLVGDAGVGSGYGSGTVSGKITGAGKLTLNPASNRELFLAGTTNDYTGGTVVSGGRITLRTNAKLGTGEVTVAPGAQIYVSAANTLTNAFSIAGDGGNGPDTQPRGALRLEGGSTIAGTVTLTANASIGSYVSSTGFVSGNIVGPFDLTINKATSTTAGTITLTGANSYAATTIGSGAVRIGKGGRSGTIGTGSIVNNGQLAFHRSDTTTLATSITGAGTVSVARGGTLNLVSGASIVGKQFEVGDSSAAGLGAGTVNILPGSSVTAANLYLGNRDGQAGTVNQSGGVVSITGASGTVGDTSLGGVRIGHWTSETSNYNLSGGSLTVAGDLSVGWDGTGRFTQTGGTASANRLVVNDGNALDGLGSGTFILNAGTFSLGSGGIVTAGGPASIEVGGGTLAATADWTSTLPITFTGAATIDTNGHAVTFNGAVSGTGSLTKNGTGTLTLNADSTVTGETVVAGGAVQVNGSIVGPVTQAGGTIAAVADWFAITLSGLIRGETAGASTGSLSPSAFVVSAQEWLRDWRTAITSRVTGSASTPSTHSGTFPSSEYFRVDAVANMKSVSGNSLTDLGLADSQKLIVWEDWTDFDWDDGYWTVTATPLEADLDVDTNNDGTIDPENSPTGKDDWFEEQSPGCILFVNSDDDNQNNFADMFDVGPVACENDLAEVVITAAPWVDSDIGSLVVTYDESIVRLYKRPDRSGETVSGSPVAAGSTLYAEGRAAGTTIVTASYTVNATRVTDTVRITVLPYPDTIDVDIDSDNNNGFVPPARSEWEDFLEDHEYGIGKLIMLDNPQRGVTPIVLEIAAGLPVNSPAVGVRIDWDVVGLAGWVRLWNTSVADALRNPGSVHDGQGGNYIAPGFVCKLADLNYNPQTGTIMIWAEGIRENEQLKTLAGVEAAPRVDERIRGTLVVNGDDAAFDEVKYIVANEDSFYHALHTRQEVRNALASRGVYTFDDMPKFSLQPKNAAGLGVDPLVAPDLGKNPRVPGLKAMIYQDYITGEDQYVLTFGGTDDKIWELEFNDWLNNIKQGLGWSAPQYTAAMEIGRAVGRAVGQTQLVVTGHSLGGGLASAAALVAGVRADTFNAAGLHEYTLYERDQNDEPLPNPGGGYVELYPGTAARYLVAGNFITARYIDYEILNFVQGFIGRTAIGVQREMDGRNDLELAIYVTGFAAAVVNRNPWHAAAAALSALDTMVELHSPASILYGLLVTESRLGGIRIDMLGYSTFR